MPWDRLVVVALLWGLACGLAGHGLWRSLRRSTIPLAIDDQVVRKKLVHEHRPGADSVPLVRFRERGWMHVDLRVFDALAVSQRVVKSSWSTTLQHDGARLELVVSRETRRLAAALPLIVAIAAAVAWAAAGVRPATRSIDRAGGDSSNAPARSGVGSNRDI